MMRNPHSVGDCVSLLLNFVATNVDIDNGFSVELPAGCHRLSPLAQVHALEVAARLIRTFPGCDLGQKVPYEIHRQATMVNAGLAAGYPRLVDMLAGLTMAETTSDDEPMVII